MNKKNRKIINARIANDGRSAKLMVTFDDGSGEHCILYDAYPYTLCHIDLDELEYEEDLEWIIRNASLF